MSLFDGQPLTEEEIAARDLCECGERRSTHTRRRWQCEHCGTPHRAVSIELAKVACRCGIGKGRWGVVSACSVCQCDEFRDPT